MSSPDHYKDLALKWLFDRGLTVEDIDRAGITVTDEAIVIPVRDINSKTLFNKYRRLPHLTNKAKYWQDKGAHATLYNISILKSPHALQVIITEGELDALLLTSRGFAAVSTTGGAGTFSDDWVGYFDSRSVFILYDNDGPGLTGAQKVASKFKEVKIALLPEGKWKDVTEYFLTHNVDDFRQDVLAKAATISSWQPDKPPTKRGEIKQAITTYNLQLSALLDEERRMSKGRENKISFDYLRALYANQQKKLGRVGKAGSDQAFGDEVAKAKAVSLGSLYQGELHYKGKIATGICPFHSEDTPSFTIYVDENRWHCFGCDAGHDTIDFIMRRDDCDFKTAVETLMKK